MSGGLTPKKDVLHKAQGFYDVIKGSQIFKTMMYGNVVEQSGNVVEQSEGKGEAADGDVVLPASKRTRSDQVELSSDSIPPPPPPPPDSAGGVVVNGAKNGCLGNAQTLHSRLLHSRFARKTGGMAMKWTVSNDDAGAALKMLEKMPPSMNGEPRGLHVTRECLEAWAEGKKYMFQQDSYHHIILRLEFFGRNDATVLVALGVYLSGHEAAFLFAVYVQYELRGRQMHVPAIQMATQYLVEQKMPASLPMQECIQKMLHNERYRESFGLCGWQVMGGEDEGSVVTFGSSSARSTRAAPVKRVEMRARPRTVPAPPTTAAADEVRPLLGGAEARGIVGGWSTEAEISATSHVHQLACVAVQTVVQPMATQPPSTPPCANTIAGRTTAPSDGKPWIGLAAREAVLDFNSSSRSSSQLREMLAEGVLKNWEKHAGPAMNHADPSCKDAWLHALPAMLGGVELKKSDKSSSGYASVQVEERSDHRWACKLEISRGAYKEAGGEPPEEFTKLVIRTRAKGNPLRYAYEASLFKRQVPLPLSTEAWEGCDDYKLVVQLERLIADAQRAREEARLALAPGGPRPPPPMKRKAPWYGSQSWLLQHLDLMSEDDRELMAQGYLASSHEARDLQEEFNNAVGAPLEQRTYYHPDRSGLSDMFDLEEDILTAMIAWECVKNSDGSRSIYIQEAIAEGNGHMVFRQLMYYYLRIDADVTFPESTRVQLQVNRQNTRAIGFYGDVGFTEVTKTEELLFPDVEASSSHMRMGATLEMLCEHLKPKACALVWEMADTFADLKQMPKTVEAVRELVTQVHFYRTPAMGGDMVDAMQELQAPQAQNCCYMLFWSQGQIRVTDFEPLLKC